MAQVNQTQEPQAQQRYSRSKYTRLRDERYQLVLRWPVLTLAILLVIMLVFSLCLYYWKIAPFVYVFLGALMGFNFSYIVTRIERVNAGRNKKRAAIDALLEQINYIKKSIADFDSIYQENVSAKQLVTMFGLDRITPWWVLAGEAGLDWLPEDERQLLSTLEGKCKFIASLVEVVPQPRLKQTGFQGTVSEINKIADNLNTLFNDLKTKM